MSLELNPKQDAESLDINQVYWSRKGYGVKDPGAGDCAVSVDSGMLDASDTLSVASGGILVDGSETSVSSASVGISSVSSGAGNRRVRKDLIWADSTGTVQKTEGEAFALSDAETMAEASRWQTVTPFLPRPAHDDGTVETPAVVLAGVVVNENDTEVTTPLIDDRRVRARAALSGGYSPVVVSSAYTSRANEVVLADASGGAFTVTLPAASDGRQVTVKKIDSSGNAVTIATANSGTIDGQSSESLASQHDVVEVVSDGGDWYII